MGGDTWQEHDRHWHCYATEAPISQNVGYEGDYTPAGSPDEVLEWLRRHLDQLGAERDRPWWGVTLAALTWGRSTGAIVATGPGMTIRLSAMSVGEQPSPHAQSTRAEAYCGGGCRS
ncbi:MAG: hypothetical protein GEU81_05135 [Nitriliruptorales bacterium]|nr:hypothetical protein [Nitriliruptorales bacterium]